MRHGAQALYGLRTVYRTHAGTVTVEDHLYGTSVRRTAAHGGGGVRGGGADATSERPRSPCFPVLTLVRLLGRADEVVVVVVVVMFTCDLQPPPNPRRRYKVHSRGAPAHTSRTKQSRKRGWPRDGNGSRTQQRGKTLVPCCPEALPRSSNHPAAPCTLHRTPPQGCAAALQTAIHHGGRRGGAVQVAAPYLDLSHGGAALERQGYGGAAQRHAAGVACPGRRARRRR